MSDREQWFIEGQRSAWLVQLRRCLTELGVDDNKDPVVQLARAQLQLEETRAALRLACDEIGDNTWPNDAWLPDVIEKRLRPFLVTEPDGR